MDSVTRTEVVKKKEMVERHEREISFERRRRRRRRRM